MAAVSKEADPFDPILRTRLKKIIDGMLQWSDWYCHRELKSYLAAQIKDLGLDGLVDKLIPFISAAFKPILAAAKPPTHEQLVAFPYNAVPSKHFASYLVPAVCNSIPVLYAGSGIDKIGGFESRLSGYTGMQEASMPRFIREHISEEHDLVLYGPVPVITFPRTNESSVVLELEYSILAKL